MVCKFIVLSWTGPMESLTTCPPPSNLPRDVLILFEIFSNLAASANRTSTSALSSANAAVRDLFIVNELGLLLSLRELQATFLGVRSQGHCWGKYRPHSLIKLQVRCLETADDRFQSPMKLKGSTIKQNKTTSIHQTSWMRNVEFIITTWPCYLLQFIFLHIILFRKSQANAQFLSWFINDWSYTNSRGSGLVTCSGSARLGL